MKESPEQRDARLGMELDERKKVGAAGNLWSIEVLYEYGRETKRHQVCNLYSKELMKFRETVISAGLLLPVREEKGEYIIVLPWHIITINVNKQPRFFEPK
jgi:hypothetical protein